MSTEQAIVAAWCEALRALYMLARGERLGELNGKRSRLIDGRGLHPLSLEVGRIMALQELMPALEGLDFNHIEIRQAAQRDAEEEYEFENAIRFGIEQKWITPERADHMRQLLGQRHSF